MRTGERIGSLAELTDRAVAAELTPDSLLLILKALPLPLVWFALDDGEVVLVNRAFEDVFGFGAAEVENWTRWSARFSDEAVRTAAPDEWRAKSHKTGFEDMLAGLRDEQKELQVPARDGRELTVLHSGVVLPAINCALAIYVDITRRKQDELRLAEAERATREREVVTRLLLDHTHEMISVASLDGALRFVSPTVQAITGWTQEQYLSKGVEVVHPEDREAVDAARDRWFGGATGQQVRYRNLKADGSYVWLESLGSCYRDPQTQDPLGYIATIRDVSHKQAEEAEQEARTALLEEHARIDHLTSLANRRVFDATLRDEARRHSRRSQPLALLLIDVDFFKQYNDRYGHLEGDRALQQIAAILKRSAQRVADLAARFGGEEFALLLPMTEPAGAELIGRSILMAIEAECIPHERSHAGCLTVSIGVACWPAVTPLDREVLLMEADRALYRAKNDGRNTLKLTHCRSASSLPDS